ncbi:MAG: MtrB/PioB family outer membrane beta-barrel protein, partial [Plesiomonas shigelloides]
YYLADRNRTQGELRVTHTPLDTLSVDVGVRYALDDYDATLIGLTESKDLGYDAALSWQLTDKVLLSGFYAHQSIDSAQAGSSDFGNPNWFADIEDKVDVYGASLAWNDLLDSRLKLGLDYSYSESDSNTQVRQGLSGNYGAYFAKVHNLNLYAEYQASERLALRMDYRMENYLDNDAANDIAVDGIWNVVSFGPQNNDYTAHLVMLSLSYKL